MSKPKLTSLPSELVHKILSHLSPAQLCNIAAVCATLCEAANCHTLWCRFVPSSENPRRDYLLSCAWRSGRGIHTETTLLTNVHKPQTIPSTISSLNATRFPVECVYVEKGFVTLGSRGGEVVRVNLESSHKQFFVGPCSCPVTAVCVNNTLVIAGFAHCVPGNGHTSGAIAWDHNGSRLAAFGGVVMRSSWAFPTAPVRHAVLGNRRVAIVCDDFVRVYEIGSWTCLLQVCFGHVVNVDMDDGKLAVVVGKGALQVLHVIDFETSLERWPCLVERIQHGLRSSIINLHM